MLHPRRPLRYVQGTLFESKLKAVTSFSLAAINPHTLKEAKATQFVGQIVAKEC